MTQPSPATIERKCEPERLLAPPWVDMVTLCQLVCVSSTTVENWVAKGILPPARKRGNKLLWKWQEVDDWLTNGNPGGNLDSQAERIRNGTRAAAAQIRPRP